MRALLLSVSAALLVCGCAQRTPIAPGTIPEYQQISREDVAYGRQVLAELRKQYPLDTRTEYNQRARAVVERLARAIGAENEPWHVYVLYDDSVKNAAATKGNYIFVWSGMLRSTQSDDELSTVLAHELGHVLAGHTQPTPGESAQQMMVGIGGMATQQALISQGYAGAGAALAAQAVGTLLQAAIINPEARRKEYEADHIGLFLLARAGYDPRAAVDFWRRMSEDPDMASTPGLAFLSTHPPTKERMAQLEGMLPAALAAYQERSSGASRAAAERGGDMRDGMRARSGLPVQFDRERDPADGRYDRDYDRRSSPRAHGGETWIVEEQEVDIYDRPQGRRIGTLLEGSAVEVERLEGRWLRISSPFRGYVQSRYLAPRASDR